MCFVQWPKSEHKPNTHKQKQRKEIDGHASKQARSGKPDQETHEEENMADCEDLDIETLKQRIEDYDTKVEEMT